MTHMSKIVAKFWWWFLFLLSIKCILCQLRWKIREAFHLTDQLLKLMKLLLCYHLEMFLHREKREIIFLFETTRRSKATPEICFINWLDILIIHSLRRKVELWFNLETLMDTIILLIMQSQTLLLIFITTTELKLMNNSGVLREIPRLIKENDILGYMANSNR